MKDADKKNALAKVFGVVNRDALLTGIPTVPGLREKLTCTGCEVPVKRGLPVEFAQYMTDDQKAEFKALTRRKRAARKKKTEE